MIAPRKLAALAQKSKDKKLALPFKGKKVMPHHSESSMHGVEHDEHDDEHEYSTEDEAHQEAESPEHEEAEREGAEEFMVKEAAEEVDEGGDDEIMELMEDYDEGDNPAWAKDHGIWKKALKAVQPEGKGSDKFDNPYAVVAHVYKKMGGRIRTGKQE